MLSAATLEAIRAVQARVLSETGQGAEVRVFLDDGRSALCWPDGARAESDGQGHVELIQGKPRERLRAV